MSPEEYSSVRGYYERPQPTENAPLSEKFTYWYPLVMASIASRKRMAIVSAIAEHPEGVHFLEMHASYRRFAGLSEVYDKSEKQEDHSAIFGAIVPLHNTHLITYGSNFSHKLTDTGKKLLLPILPKVQELYQKGIISENRLGNQVNGIDMTIHVLFALDQKKMSYTQLYDTLMIFPMVDEKRIIRVLDKLTDTDTTEEPPLIRDDGHTIQLTSDGQRFLDTFLKPVAGQLALLLQ